MYCSHCGQQLPPHANFCPSCGSPVMPGGAPTGTTASIDLGLTDQQAPLEDIPELEAGTGMFVVVRGPGAGARFLLDRPVTSIGRHPDADLFLDDVTVSRNHAEVRSDDEGMVLHDLGSLNGTYVGSDRVDQHRLKTGDEVQVGRFKLVFVGANTA